MYVKVFPYIDFEKKISSPQFYSQSFNKNPVSCFPVPSRPGSGAEIGALGLGYDSLVVSEPRDNFPWVYW